LIGVADDAGEQLAAPGALEEAEGQRLEVAEQAYAQVPHHALFYRHAAHRRPVSRRVLDHERDEEHQDHVAQRRFGRPDREQRPGDASERLLHRGGAGRR